MIKLIASDLDGTLLLNDAQSLNPELFDLILKLKEKGIHFIAASGRQYASMHRLFAPIKDQISYITENGSLCFHEGEITSMETMNRELGLRILEDIHNRKNCHILLSCQDTYYTDSEKVFYHMRDTLHSDIKLVPDVSEIQEPFLKIAVYDDVTIADTARYFYEKYNDLIPVATSGTVWVDFVLPNANKGTALQAFAEYFHVKPEECMAFGDQQNDIEMLEFAGESYAMEKAAPGVASHAKYTTNCVEDVLRELLKSLL